MSIFPMVPGHEIVGDVVDIGKDVTKFHQGDRVGVSVYCDNECRSCEQCRKGRQQYCSRIIFTYSDR